MKKKLINVLLGVSLVIVTAASVVSARQVVTEQDREWARKAAEQEKTLHAQPVSKSVAILYFNNKTELADLNPIQKGLAIMLITDLAKVEGLQIVERARLEALVSELNLAQKGLTDPAGNVRIGRFLRAEHVVGGDMLKGAISDFKVKSSLLNVPREEIFGNPQAEGKLLSELFKMEKELLFEIIKELKIKLTPEQEAELQKPLTTNLNALLAWFAALDYSDLGDYAKADESAQQACAQDPGLCKMMDEIREEIKVAAAEVENGLPKDAWETYGSTILPAADLHPPGKSWEIYGSMALPEVGFLPPGNTDDPTDRHSECIEVGYVSVPMPCGIGACRSTGWSSCVGGKVIDSCVPGAPVNAIDSTCNGIDDNCNGQIDEDYVSMTTTCGVGACSSTASTSCVGGREIDSCVPGAPVNAIDSTCNGIDDNCNGQIDEGYVSMTTTCGVGACSSTASTSCVGGREIDSCVPGAPVNAIDSTCNGIDDNCNGQIDEGYVSSMATTCGAGSCSSTGSISCVGGREIDSCVPGAPVNEIDSTCNGIDDNCNGQIDEDYESMATTCGTGSCSSTGSISCVGGREIDSCVSGAPLNEIDSTCDGIDDNCNGQIDEGYVSMTTTCGLGVCSSTGSISCVGGREIDSCVSGTFLNEIDSTCDGIDDNCNGEIDEDYVSITTTCGLGVCSSTGSLSCVGGSVIDSCVSGLPVAEICEDGIDNDCNGAVDEGCSTPPVVSMESIDTAHSNTFNDPVLASKVENGEFVPGGMEAAENAWRYVWTGAYTFGLQTMGADADGPASFLHPSFLEQINADPHLAYAVQLEEDRLNRQILEMQARAVQNDLLATINNALNAGDIRSRDDLLMQQADAQAGRVLKDWENNWVRTQQYILRPDNQTVQMLNVSLRGNGTHAGLSTIDWTTSFRAPIPVAQSLRDLPWSDYLNTRSDVDGSRYIRLNGQGLDSMSVRFTNPTSQYLQESRTFGPIIFNRDALIADQPILKEQLTSSQWQGTLVYGTDYSVRSEGSGGINPDGFSYFTDGGETVLASVSFHVLGDANTDTNIGESTINFHWKEVYFRDIWDALRVNELGAPNIDDNNLETTINNNLEIVIDGGMFNASSIDTVYIPLSRMLWKKPPE